MICKYTYKARGMEATQRWAGTRNADKGGKGTANKQTQKVARERTKMDDDGKDVSPGMP